MKIVHFNFNNEVDILELNMDEETGEVTIPQNNELSFENMEKFAEYYAMARNVSADNLKNWVLLEDGDVYTFTLRAATAGSVAAADVRDELVNAINRVAGETHPLEVITFRQQVENANDLVRALANASNQTLSRAVYDELDRQGVLVEEEVDKFADFKEFMDNKAERTGSYALFAHALNMDLEASQEAIINRVDALDYSFGEFVDVYQERIIADSGRANVSAGKPELLAALVTGAPAGKEDTSVAGKVTTMAQLAGRSKVNIRNIRVGHRYVKDDVVYTDVTEAPAGSVRDVNGYPVIFIFDGSVDAEVEAELENAEDEEEEQSAYPELCVDIDEDDEELPFD